MSDRKESLAEALNALDESHEVASHDPQELKQDAKIENAGANSEGDEARSRDDFGRFERKKAIEQDIDKSTEVAQSDQDQQIQIQRPEAPKSWKQEYKQHWDKLDPDVAKYVGQREEEMSRGVEIERQRMAPAVQLYESVQPFIDEIRQTGRDPNSDLRDLLHTRRLLATGDETTKLHTLVNIAHSIGIPLHQMLQQSAAVPQHMQQQLDPNVIAAQTQARNAQWQLAQEQQRQQLEAQRAAENMVHQFGQNHPHLDELGPTMQRLLQSGEAVDLDSAYSKALRLNDKLFEQTQAQQRQDAEKQRRQDADKAAKAAKANAVSTRTATPGSSATTGSAAKGRKAFLEEAFSEVDAGRI